MINKWLETKDAIEIKQHNDGKWYVCKHIKEEKKETMLKPCRELYLNKNGNWYSTTSPDGKWSGYFDTKEEAELALKASRK